MGEIAEAVVEGLLCQQCGDMIGEGDVGPRTCAACESKASEVRIKTPAPQRPSQEGRPVYLEEEAELRAWLVRNGWTLQDEGRGQYQQVRAFRRGRLFVAYRREGGRWLTVPKPDRDISRAFTLEKDMARKQGGRS